MSYLQCPKRLYLEHHDVGQGNGDAGFDQRLAQGQQVGELARMTVKGGSLIGHDLDLQVALAETRARLAHVPPVPIFEATFQHKGLLVRTDLLVPHAKGYRLVEVKSTTSVKEHHLPDCAIQAWALQGAGIELHSVELMHIDSGFIYPGGEDYTGLFTSAELSEEIREIYPSVARWLQEARRTLDGGLPDISVGNQCNAPYPCPFIEYCSAEGGLPEFPVSILPGNDGKRLAAELIAEGIAAIQDIPDGRLPEKFERIRRATLSSKAEITPGAAQKLLGLKYPLHYLDFEGIQFAVPIWAGTRPYQQLPFQWSCHIEQSDGSLDHHDFLDISGQPPMKAFAESLIEHLGNKGAILVYNQTYEASRVKELAEMFPMLSKPLMALVDRMVDLLPITRTHYYHPAMKGSWSIKAVLPTIAPELDYSQLHEVQDGTAAQCAYLEIIDPMTNSDRRTDLQSKLLDYCKLDTLALVRLAGYLRSFS